MLKIAIIDDEKFFLNLYSQLIKDIFAEYYVTVELKTFCSGSEFITFLSKFKFDLLFIDIDMPEFSGIDIAEKLRKNYQNLDIIFVSAHPHFVFEAIRFNPYRFIRKSNLKPETKEAISSYCNRTQIKYKMITFELQNGRITSEKVNNIVCFFAVRHTVYLVNNSESETKILSRKHSLTQIEQTTKEYGFIRVHKSYLLNYRYIKSINAKSVILSNDDEIPISHGKKIEIQDTFMKFLRKEEMI